MPSAVNLASPAGTIQAFGGTSAPAGWLLCTGASLNRTDYPALFAAIGTAFGSASGTTFNVPDFRGRFLRMVSGAATTDPDRAGRAAMATGGNTANNVGSVQGDAFQGHWHEMWGTAGQGVNPGVADDVQNPSSLLSSASVRTAVNDGANGTPRTTSETRPVNAYVNYIIKY